MARTMRTIPMVTEHQQVIHGPISAHLFTLLKRPRLVDPTQIITMVR